MDETTFEAVSRFIVVDNDDDCIVRSFDCFVVVAVAVAVVVVEFVIEFVFGGGGINGGVHNNVDDD